MADGSKKPIEQVQVGDLVIATDPETGEQAAKRVEEVFVHLDTVIDLRLSNGEKVTTTENHPFWSVTDGEFERADQLAPGERVLAADGRVLDVAGLTLGSVREAFAYNLAVQGIHTYHVGQSEILVHNTCSLDLSGLAHAAERHLPGGAKTAGKSVFHSGADLVKLSRTSGTIGRRQANGRIAYAMRANASVGIDRSTGQATNSYTVIRGGSGRLVTMFPGSP